MNNNTSKKWKWYALILTILNIALLLFLFIKNPEQKQFGNHPKDGGPAKFIIEKLKFNKEQENEFMQLKEAHFQSMDSLQKDGAKLREYFFNGLKTDNAIELQDSILQCILVNQRNRERITYEHFVAVKKLCSPDQKNEFNKIIQEIIQRMKGPQPIKH